MKAVIYARYSSDNQREESIEGQLRECMEYAERHGMTIVDTYIDRALSAKTDNRPRFQAMIKDSSKQLFEVVLVWKLDRFARNRFDSAVYKNKLKKNGVRVVSAREAIAEGADGILLEAVLEGYAEYFSVDLAEKVSRGMKENALKCKNNGSVIPLGYYVDDDQHLQVDEKKAPYVREIFGRYANGETIKDIVYDMNIRGITLTVSLKRANDGRKSYEKPLNYNMIHRMLRNRKYIGEYKFSDVVVPGGVPAIVDLDTFNRAQERMKTNKSTPEKQKERAEFILNSNAPIERKLEDLAYNPFSKRDIVKYIIENGMLLENVFYPDRMLDEQGNDFRDFIESDNNFYFRGIETLLEDIDVKSIKNTETKKLIEKCTRAVEMWNVLNDLYCALPVGEDCDMEDFENFYDLALNHIVACGEYYFRRSKSSKNYYIEGQNNYLIETLCEALNPYSAMSFKEYCKKTKANIQGE